MPSMRSVTGWPMRTLPISLAGTGASISIRERSTMERIRLSGDTFSPTWAKRSATTPVIGASTEVSASALRACASCAVAASRLATVTW